MTTISPETIAGSSTKITVFDATTKTAHSQRFAVIDMVRGVAMILMALDHWAAFAHVNLNAEGYGGVRPSVGSIWYIIVGLITNLASSIFFTLTGASVAFFERSRRNRGWTEWEITRFLLIRAVILLVLDQVINYIGWGVTEAPLFEILSAIAATIIVLAFTRLLPLRWIALLSVLLFFGYPALVGLFPYNPNQPLSIIPTILFQYDRSGFPMVETPALGRLSLVLVGYVFGRLLNERKINITTRWLWVALAGFIVWFLLRLGLLHGYGDFLPYEPGSSLINFFIDSKHPPSLTFLLFTMSWSIILLIVLKLLEERLNGTFISWILTTLGQTALFFFVAHMLFYKLLAVFLGGGHMINPAWFSHIDLFRLFVECALTLVILVPLCAVYRGLRSKYTILHYL